MKRPSFQFYPSDWRNDAGLKLCSVAARGLWIEMMCVMHAAEPYGHLCAAGRPLDARDLAKFVGESERDVKRWMEELLRNNVYSINAEGVIFSRRMVRDEDLRNRRGEGGEGGKQFGQLGAEHGKKGGRPRKETGDKKPPLEPPPSSSSSSSSSNTPPTPKGAEPAEPAGFVRFWSAWPAGGRKEARGKCLEAWKRAKAEGVADEVLAHVERLKAGDDWKRDNGRFIPAPLVYLNGRRWEGAETGGTGSLSGLLSETFV